MYNSKDSIGTIAGEILAEIAMIIIVLLFIKYFPYTDILYKIIISDNNIVFLCIGLLFAGFLRVWGIFLYRKYKKIAK